MATADCSTRVSPVAQLAAANVPAGSGAALSRTEDYHHPATTPAGARTADADGAPASCAPRPTATPYTCVCGAPDPYIGKRPVRKGGHGCPKCARVELQIHAAQMAAYREIAAAAYRDGCHGDEKQAILKRAEEVSGKVWREMQISFGIDLGREARLAEGQVAA